MTDDAIQRAVRARLTSFADDGTVATIEASAHKLAKRVRRALQPDRLVPAIENASLRNDGSLHNFVLVYGKAKRESEAVAVRAVAMIDDEGLPPENSYLFASMGNVYISFRTTIGVSYVVR